MTALTNSKPEVLVMQVEVMGEFHYVVGFTKEQMRARANEKFPSWTEIKVMTQKETLNV